MFESKADVSALETKADLSALGDCWKKDDSVISSESGFHVGGLNSTSADFVNGVFLGNGAGLVDYEGGGSLVLEHKYATNQIHYRTTVLTPNGVQQISKDGADEPVVHGRLRFPMNDGQSQTLATTDDIDNALSALGGYLPLSGGTLTGTLGAQNVYGSQFTSNSECQTGGGQTYASFGNNGILMGRSPNLLRVLWPFNQELGNNQTFAT